MKKIIPDFVKDIVVLWFAFFLFMLAARIFMYVLLRPELAQAQTDDIIYALYIGAKFDARLAVFSCLPLAVTLCFFRKYLPVLEKYLLLLYGCVFVGLVLSYALDLGFYFYLRQRLDATLFELMHEGGLSLSMIWETYPVIWISLGLVSVTACFVWALKFYLDKIKKQTLLSLSRLRHLSWAFLSAVLLFLLAYGQLSSNLFPLRWSNAYFSPNRYVVILALNPLQNLYDTWVLTRTSQPDLALAKAAYGDMANWLGVENKDQAKLNYWRTHQGQKAENLNVVIIIMESLALPRTSLASSLHTPSLVTDLSVQENVTPNVLALAEKSLYFRWFFSPARTTARAIFTTITGIPDVNRSSGTSSRNPALVDQFTVFNEFNPHAKSYMLGGSANWANIRGVLTHNVKDLNLLEEGYWKGKNVDVWGISDLQLFREAVDYLNHETQPFISIIQTSAFHRPWTIPEDNAGFVPQTVDNALLRRYGFENQDEYNSLRFSDHALGEFFRLAADKAWFKNTVFAIFGDHGLNENSGNMTGGYLACRLQGSHVPLLLYAPGRPDLFSPGISDRPSGQPDILPTLANLAGLSFNNHGLGRDLLNPALDLDSSQFIAGDVESFVRLVEGNMCYYNEGREALYDLNGSDENLAAKYPDKLASMRSRAYNTLHTSKYLLFNNKKRNAPQIKNIP